MAGTPKEPGPTSARVAANLRRIRRAADVTTAALSKRLAAIGHPIADTGITKTEKGDRRVDADDLVALALALGVTPNTLLLPQVDYLGAPGVHHVTPVAGGTAEELWLWAQGERPLPVLWPESRAWLGGGEHPILEFAVRNRPYLTAVSAPGEDEVPGIPYEALRDVSAAASRALRAGASGSQIRRVIELSMVLPVIMAMGRGRGFGGDGTRPGEEEP
jgi:transcriptional regulator with XRE-family HTH domain